MHHELGLYSPNIYLLGPLIQSAICTGIIIMIQVECLILVDFPLVGRIIFV